MSGWPGEQPAGGVGLIGSYLHGLALIREGRFAKE